MATNYNNSIVTDGLVLCLDAGDGKSYSGSGSTWTDRSGNGNNGTLANGVGYNSANGGSLTFDGLDDRVIILDDPSFTITETTVCAWFNASVIYDASKVNRAVFSSYDAFGRQYYGLRIDAGASNNKIYSYYDDNAGYGFSILRGTTDLLQNTWYYGCMTWKSGTFHRVYLNGLLESEETDVATATLDISSAFYVGMDFGSSTGYFNGKIPQVSIYNRALTASEILQNFNAQRGRFGI